jgi:DNA-binding HxlR family transcriptional regulator
VEDANPLSYAVGANSIGTVGPPHPSASKKVLTENLRDLEASGLVVRRDFSSTVRHIEYDFCEAMRPAMNLILDHLGELGDYHLAQGEEGIL